MYATNDSASNLLQTGRYSWLACESGHDQGNVIHNSGQPGTKTVPLGDKVGWTLLSGYSHYWKEIELKIDFRAVSDIISENFFLEEWCRTVVGFVRFVHLATAAQKKKLDAELD